MGYLKEITEFPAEGVVFFIKAATIPCIKTTWNDPRSERKIFTYKFKQPNAELQLVYTTVYPEDEHQWELALTINRPFSFTQYYVYLPPAITSWLLLL